jgi:hypothetical protein
MSKKATIILTVAAFFIGVVAGGWSVTDFFGIVFLVDLAS